MADPTVAVAHGGAGFGPGAVSRPEFRPDPLANVAAVHREALERLAPPSVIVDDAYRIASFLGVGGPEYLPFPGERRPTTSWSWRARNCASNCGRRFTAPSRTAKHSLGPPVAVRFNGAAKRVFLQARPLGDDAEGEPFGDRLFHRGPGTVAAAASDGLAGGRRAPAEEVPAPRAGVALHPVASARLAGRIRRRERGAACGERRASVDQRGVSLDRRGAGDQQGGIAVDRRGASDGQRRAEDRARPGVAQARTTSRT